MVVSLSPYDKGPDGWEYQYGLDLSSDDTTGDPDQDGATNLQEFHAGTNPRVNETLVALMNYDKGTDLLSKFQHDNLSGPG